MKKLLYRLVLASHIVLLQLFSVAPVSAILFDDQKAINLGVPIWFGGDIAIQCTSASTLDGFLQALAYKESRGNPTAVNPSPLSSAAGKYQYLTGTWRSRSSLYGPAGQYATANLAPEEVQDAVAYLDHLRTYKRFDGDFFKMAVEHFYPAANRDTTLLDRRAPGANTESPREYANHLLELMDSGEASHIPMLYSNAPDFERWLAEAGGAADNLGCASGGIPSGDFVHYRQCDNRWRNHAFGSTTLCSGGCGPASVAMVLATMYDRSITPVEVADWGTANGGHQPGDGSVWSVMMERAPSVLSNGELEVNNFGGNLSNALSVLEEGGLVIATGHRTGPPYTNGGHIIVIREALPNGNFLIGDPALTGGYSFDHEWTFADLNRGRNFWGVTKTEGTST